MIPIQWFLPGRMVLVKTHVSWLHPESVWFSGLGWSLRIGISNKLPGDTAAAHSGITVQESLTWSNPTTSQMRKMRPGERKGLVQGYLTGQWPSCGSWFLSQNSFFISTAKPPSLFYPSHECSEDKIKYYLKKPFGFCKAKMLITRWQCYCSTETSDLNYRPLLLSA